MELTEITLVTSLSLSAVLILLFLTTLIRVCIKTKLRAVSLMCCLLIGQATFSSYLTYNLVHEPPQFFQSIISAGFVTLTTNLAYWIFAFSYWQLSRKIQNRTKQLEVDSQTMNTVFFWGTMLNALFPVLYMIFGLLQIQDYYSKTMKYTCNSCYYCCALFLIASCLILLNALYQISTHLKDLTHFVINTKTMIAHGVAFVIVLIGLVSSNIFMIVGGTQKVTNFDYINILFVAVVNFVCSVVIVVIFNWIASKATVERGYADETQEEVEYLSQGSDESDDILNDKQIISTVQNENLIEIEEAIETNRSRPRLSTVPFEKGIFRILVTDMREGKSKDTQVDEY